MHSYSTSHLEWVDADASVQCFKGLSPVISPQAALIDCLPQQLSVVMKFNQYGRNWYIVFVVG